MYKVIYLASGRAQLKYPNVVYNDIKEKRDIVGDMLSVDLTPYDILIATPPCNYYSRANKSRETSLYAQRTKHLLPTIIKKFIQTGKPFIVENVRNSPLFKANGLYDFNCFVYFHGRHTYWTNIMFSPDFIPQEFDFKQIPGYGCVRLKNYVQGGKNVNDVLDYFLEVVSDKLREKNNSTEQSVLCELIKKMIKI